MKPGRLRKRAAKILSDLFGFDIDAERVVPVSGFWKSEDVYRWEVSTRRTGETSGVSIGCWESLADFCRNAKNGICVTDLYGRDVDPLKSRGAIEVCAIETLPKLEVR